MDVLIHSFMFIMMPVRTFLRSFAGNEFLHPLGLGLRYS